MQNSKRFIPWNRILDYRIGMIKLGYKPGSMFKIQLHIEEFSLKK